MQIVRLMYASKINKNDSNLKSILIQMLDEAVDFNYRNNVTGVLYYGDGYLIQCIEGQKKIIDELFFNKIIKDVRQKHCEILHYADCNKRIFSQWSMKFLPINKKIKDFFMQYHFAEFNPYLLTTESTKSFISILADPV